MALEEIEKDKTPRPPKEGSVLLIELSTREAYCYGFKLKIPNRSHKQDSKQFLLLKHLYCATKLNQPTLSYEEIYHLLWGNDLPEEPSKQLSGIISKLKKAFGEIAAMQRDNSQSISPYNIDELILIQNSNALQLGLSVKLVDAAWKFIIPRKWRID